MRVNVASRVSPRPLPHHYYPYSYNPPSPNTPPSPVPSLTRRRGIRRSESATFGAPLNKLPRYSHLLRRTITSRYFGAGPSSNPSFSSGDEFPSPRIEEFAFFDGNEPPITSSRPFFPSNLDLLEPSLLGIRPEPAHWSAREDVIWESIARKASCVELPLSLRMLKKKIQERSVGGGGGGRRGRVGGVDGISKAFSSTVSVIGELQGHAIRLRGLALNEDVESIAGKVQTEMNSSFIWLFQEVFSRTPDLMVNVMLLTVDFASTSMEKNCNMASQPAAQTMKNGSKQQQRQKQDGGIVEEELLDGLAQMTSTSHSVIEICKEEEEEESKLWNSMVQEAYSTIKMHPQFQFVAPVKVDIEKDDYSEYHRTNLLYQIGVSEEPNNPLLLCNYAQFLCLVARDYDRAEECFQRAIQVDSTDPEVLSQYATFLWVIRKDLWGAEERYQQAVAAQPDNTYHASKYASFLWNTGGDDTCFPIDDAS